MPRQVIYLGADHAGFELKERLKKVLGPTSYRVVDLSPKFKDGDDYPEVGFTVAKHVAEMKDARGVLVCGSGVGVTMAANRIPKVRAFDAYDEKTTKLAREHNDANVVALSGWHLPPAKALKLLKLFLATKFSKAERHHRRVKQLA